MDSGHSPVRLQPTQHPFFHGAHQRCPPEFPALHGGDQNGGDAQAVAAQDIGKDLIADDGGFEASELHETHGLL